MPKPIFKLGINLGFAINRFPEPEVWAPIVKDELGLDCVQFVADLLNPFLPPGIVAEQTTLIKKLTAEYGIKVQSTFTSAFTRVNHLMHPDPRQRAVWIDWFKAFVKLSADLGASNTGSHFGIMSVHDENKPDVKAKRVREAVEAWQEISRYAADAGLEYLIFEPMSCPRENAWTIEETLELRDKVNAGSAIPMEICLDLGHAPHPDQRDPYEWIERTGRYSPVIHLQQTEQDHSRHWPFTEECNAKGIIHPERVMETLAKTGREEFYLYFEIGHRERWPDDTKVIDDLKASADYWRKFVQ